MSVSAGAAHETEAPGGPARGLLGRTSATLRMIKVSHTVFAMPFALAALLLATDGRPTPWVLSWVVVALVGARSAGMAFNRLVDVRFDAANPRTRGRELPSDKLGRNFVRGFVLVACGVFVLAAGMLNPLCLALSPLALAVVLGYSFAKRFTAASHLWLGVALGISPVCAWLAVTGRFDESLWIPAPFSAAVLLWVAGFDLIYACQDADFDRSAGLHSVPARFGVPVALRLSALCHVLCVALLALAVRRSGLGPLSWAAVLLVAGLLVCEHRVARAVGGARLEEAFFAWNSSIGPIVLAGVAGDLWW